MKTLEHFEKIITLLSDVGLCDEYFAKASEHLDFASAYLRVNQTQAVLFSWLLESFTEGPVSIKKLAEDLKCKNLEVLKYLDDFDVLCSKKLIRSEKISSDMMDPFSGRRRKEKFPKYSVPLDVINAIRNGVEYQFKVMDNLSPEEFFDCIGDLFDASEDNEIDLDTLISEVNSLIDLNKHISFSKHIKNYPLDDISIVILLLFCCALIHENEDTLYLNALRGKLGRRIFRRIESEFEVGDQELITYMLIEYDCQMGMADTEKYRLSQKAKDEFLTDVDIEQQRKQKGKDIIHEKNIKAKKLYYGKKIKERIDELTTLLEEENFINIQKRLEENGMRTGFPCIFSGPPGTGKTETVFQIAKKTGRDIYLVDISESKSMWYGESEKRIKAVFDRYRGMLNSSKLAPILLFNEADAILGKRQELSNARSGPGQTENAIQNIILQEIENLSGILIATTNLTVNLDKAFERRFLYKIEFEKPDTATKRQLWKSLIPDLREDDASHLSVKFDLSGGQIENISRKCTVNYVLSGTKPSLNRMIELCEEEQFSKETSFRIGFGTS